MKFFFSKKNLSDDNLNISTFLLKKLGYRPKNIQLFEVAFTHKSYSNTLDGVSSNERLEYLGDRVIDLIVAEFLFLSYPQKDEGELTKIKSKIVSRKTLSEVGDEMGILPLIRYKKGRSINTATLVGNAFEALFGAIYLDGGYHVAHKCFNQYIIRNYIDLEKVLEEEIDFKSALLIWCQKNKLQLKFNVVEDATKENNLTYKINVSINHKVWGIGKAKNKKEAEQKASKETIELLGI